MQQLRFTLRVAVLAVIINGVSQALITYAIVPGKYENESYNVEQVREIAYAERKAGIDSLYGHSVLNASAFAILGILATTEMWVSNRIDLSRDREQASQQIEPQAEVTTFTGLLRNWPITLAMMFAILSLFFLFG